MNAFECDVFFCGDQLIIPFGPPLTKKVGLLAKNQMHPYLVVIHLYVINPIQKPIFQNGRTHTTQLPKSFWNHNFPKNQPHKNPTNPINGLHFQTAVANNPWDPYQTQTTRLIQTLQGRAEPSGNDWSSGFSDPRCHLSRCGWRCPNEKINMKKTSRHSFVCCGVGPGH